MIDGDLTKNMLEDNLDKLPGEKTQKAAKRALSGYGKAQKWLMYFAIAKWVGIGVVLMVLAWGGVALYNGAKAMVTEAVVGEVKEVATDAKDKAVGQYEAAKTKVKSKTEGQSLGGALAMFAKSANEKMDAAVNDALIETGFHPDAPASCALQDPKAPRYDCLKYSAVEIGGNKYQEVNGLWEDVCPAAYANFKDVLKSNGLITHNDYRKLDAECVQILNDHNEAAVDSIKQKMIEGM